MSTEPRYLTAPAPPAVAARSTHRRVFQNRSPDPHEAPRVVDYDATPEQVRHLEGEGYVLRERLIRRATGPHRLVMRLRRN